MESGFSKWLAAALVLVVGGTLGVTAILSNEFTAKELSCTDVENIVAALKDDPQLLPFQQKVVPLTGCGTKIEPQCSLLPDGTFCRQGIHYGPKMGGVKPRKSPNDPIEFETCVVTDGKTIPCTVEGGMSAETYDETKLDAADVIKQLQGKMPAIEAQLESVKP